MAGKYGALGSAGLPVVYRFASICVNGSQMFVSFVCV